MDLVQRELTKLATAAVIVDEMSKAAQVQDGMAKQAKMKPGLIALLAALGLTGAAGGAYAAGAFGGTPLRHAMARAMRPTPVESAESLRAKAEADKASNPYNPPVKPMRISPHRAARNARAYVDAVINAIFSDAHAPEPKAGGAARDARGGTLTPLRHAMARAMRPTPVESAESLRAKAEREFSNTLTDNINRLLGR